MWEGKEERMMVSLSAKDNPPAFHAERRQGEGVLSL